MSADDDGAVSDEAEGRLTERLASRARRPEARRGLRGAATFYDRLPDRAAGVHERGAARAQQFGDRQAGGSLNPFRAIRYRSGPWEGAGREFLPVSWFLLWRSNVAWVPDPAWFEKQPIGSGRPAAPTPLEPTRVPRRDRPLASVVHPARQRRRPRSVMEDRRRPRPPEEE